MACLAVLPAILLLTVWLGAPLSAPADPSEPFAAARPEWYFLSLFQQAGLRPRIAERVPDMSMIRSMVANGFGYSLANMRPLTDIAPDGTRLVTVPVGGDHQPLMLGMATARTRSKPRILETFEEHCRAAITDTHIPGMLPVR